MTRAEHWTNSNQRPISADEWLSVVTADPELRIDTSNGPLFAVWSESCSHPEGGWFDWTNGCVSTKNPDRAVLGKMLRIATKLNATVQGDDGEFYARVEDLPPNES